MKREGGREKERGPGVGGGGGVGANRKREMEMRGRARAVGFLLNQCMPYSPHVLKLRTVSGDEIAVYRIPVITKIKGSS